MLLTAAELAELTQRKRAAAQCRALDAMGIVYLRDADGHPRVLRSLVERLMGAEQRAMLANHEPELHLEPPPSQRSTPSTVRVFQARRVLAGQKG